MRNFLIIGLLLTATVALAGKTGDDSWQIGNPTSVTDKKLIFDTGDGTLNKSFILNQSTKKLSTNVDELKIGSGAAANQSIILNRGGSNPVIRWNESNSVLEFSNDGTSFLNVGSGSGGGGGGLSILATNPDFEQSLALGWTASGLSFTATTVGSNLLFGKQSALIDSSATGQNVISDAYVIPAGLWGKSCSAQVFYKGGDATYKLQALDGSNAVITEAFFPGPSVATVPFSVSFPCPSSGSLKLAIASTANGAAMAVDRTSIGESGGLLQISQAVFVGAAIMDKTASTFFVTTSSSFVSFGAAGAGTPPARTVLSNPGPGVIQTTASNSATFTINSLPPGTYGVTIGVQGSASATGTDCAMFKISDGTSLSSAFGVPPSTTNAIGYVTHTGYFNYTNAGNHTFEIFAADTCGTTNGAIADLRDQPITFSIVKFPNVLEQAFRPDQVANSYSGSFVGPSCTWVSTATTPSPPARPAISTGCTLLQKTNTNFGTVVTLDDGTPGNNLPGVIFTPSRPGSYSVCLNPTLQSSTNVQYTISLQGTQSAVNTEITRVNTGNGANWIERNPVCGIYRALSTAPVTLELKMYNNAGTAEFSTNGEASPASALDVILYQIDYALPAPLIIPAVVQPAKSLSSGSFSTSSGSFTPVTNLSLAVTQNQANKSWSVGLESDGLGTAATYGCTIAGASVNVQCYLRILRDGVEIAQYQVGGVAGSFQVYTAVSSVRHTDINPPVGSHTYTVELYQTNNGGGGNAHILNAVLEAHQLP